jgi:hypothetical protein
MQTRLPNIRRSKTLPNTLSPPEMQFCSGIPEDFRKLFTIVKTSGLSRVSTQMRAFGHGELRTKTMACLHHEKHCEQHANNREFPENISLTH